MAQAEARLKTQQEIVSGINAWPLSVSTVLLGALGHGEIDHVAHGNLSPTSQLPTRILLVFWQTFFDLGPGGLEVLPRRVSETLPPLPGNHISLQDFIQRRINCVLRSSLTQTTLSDKGALCLVATTAE